MGTWPRTRRLMFRFQAFKLQPGPVQHLVCEESAEEDLR